MSNINDFYEYDRIMNFIYYPVVCHPNTEGITTPEFYVTFWAGIVT